MENEARRKEKLEKATDDERAAIEKNEAAQIESVKAYDAKTGGDSFIDMTEQKKNNFSNALMTCWRKFRSFCSKKKADTAEDKQSFNLVGKSDQERFFVGIDKRKTYIGIGIFAVILISFFSINSWFTTSKYESNVKASKAELTKESANDTAVTGNHLQNVPKDYKTLAEKEKLYKSQSGNSESYSNDSYAAKRNQNSSAGTQDRAVYSEPVTRSAPPAPYVPPRPSGAAIERKVDPAEEAYAKALEKQLELKAKANESPIRFELNKDN